MAKEIVRASLDRFEENDLAVVYADDGRKFDVPRGLISRKAREGARLKLLLQDSEVIRVIVDHEDASELEWKIKEKLERLKHNQQK